jgi:hypothetical protein
MLTGTGRMKNCGKIQIEAGSQMSEIGQLPTSDLIIRTSF